MRAARTPTWSRRSLSRRPRAAGIRGGVLRKHIRYDVGERERAGVERFFALAAEVGAVTCGARRLRFYEGADAGRGSPEPAAAGASGVRPWV